jgi:hypothetical protein
MESERQTRKSRINPHVWIFDAQSNLPGITKKERPLSEEHFAEFEKRYGDDPNGKSKRRDTGTEGRFRKFHIGENQRTRLQARHHVAQRRIA